MAKRSENPTGFTKDGGWQIGAQRTIPIYLENAWRLLTSSEGLKIWLGSVSDIDFEEGSSFKLVDETTGTFKVIKPNSHVRVTWQSPEWERASTIQLRIIGKEGKTTVAFHQENLPGEKERELRCAFFKSALYEIERIVSHR